MIIPLRYEKIAGGSDLQAKAGANLAAGPPRGICSQTPACYEHFLAKPYTLNNNSPHVQFILSIR
jgi:hypothetical protein